MSGIVCRIFEKKRHHKTLDNPISSFLNAVNEGALQQILEYRRANNSTSRRFLGPIELASNHVYPADSFMELTSLLSPNSSTSQNRE
ncbi:hypothetical protein V6N11_069309 [Hibiscus sabdariffa]|uniref:Uncharacterized protein n=1 Tax=Hibiscus sabdariffa TaxID=183260 RepID=A0ABR1ZYW1_9ROSI